MVRIVKTEFYKLKRYHILWAGVALMLLSVLLTLFTSMANDGSVWDFAYLTEQVIKNNMSMIFPMCISLIAGYMISREQTDDTLKNILTVPISFKKLLTGKLIVCGVLSIIFGLICSLFTIIAEMIVGFPGFEISLALKAALQITAVNFFLYLAVLPIIALTCRRAGSFLVGVIIAFVYGYGGMFAAGNMTLANLYPGNRQRRRQGTFRTGYLTVPPDVSGRPVQTGRSHLVEVYRVRGCELSACKA